MKEKKKPAKSAGKQITVVRLSLIGRKRGKAGQSTVGYAFALDWLKTNEVLIS